MDTSRLDGVKGTPRSHLQDGLNSLLLLDRFQSRFFPFPLNFFQNRLGLLELLLDLLLALRVPNGRFFGDARLGLDPNCFQLLGHLPLLLGDGAHGLELLGDGLGAARLHLLFFCLDLRG